MLAEIKGKRLLTIFVLFIAAVGFFNAFRFGGASARYYAAEVMIESWQSNAHIQTKYEYKRAKAAVFSANVLHGSNTSYINLAGQIEEWGFLSGFDKKASLENAKINYLQATKVRPLWPVTWANLARVKWRLKEYDEEMLRYLNLANELGPYSVEVHMLFTRLGLSLYNAKHPMYEDIKDIVHERIRLGLRNRDSKTSIVTFIETADSLVGVCQWITIKDVDTAVEHLNCA
ncbi:MAG: hypothetical protein ACJA0G_002240 [Kangiellaceae bacterium]|jgi:hypothetical protein